MTHSHAPCTSREDRVFHLRSLRAAITMSYARLIKAQLRSAEIRAVMKLHLAQALALSANSPQGGRPRRFT